MDTGYGRTGIPWDDRDRLSQVIDLTEDPAEADNLISDDSPEVQAVIKELHTKLVQQMKQINDPALQLSTGASN